VRVLWSLEILALAVCVALLVTSKCAQKGKQANLFFFNMETEAGGERERQQGQKWQVSAMVQQVSHFINHMFSFARAEIKGQMLYILLRETYVYKIYILRIYLS